MEKTELIKYIKGEVKRISKEKGMTQTDLARKIDVAPATLSRTLSGNPSLDTLHKISEGLGVPVGDLFPRSNISGFLEVQGEVYKVQSKNSIEKLIGKL